MLRQYFSDGRELFEFMIAVAAIDPIWSSSQEERIELEQKKYSEGNIPKLPIFIERFRNRQRKYDAIKGSVRHGVFGTGGLSLKGEDQDGKKSCLCGQVHSYSKCYYVKPSTRPEVWKGKQDTFKRINDAIISNRRYPSSSTTDSKSSMTRRRVKGTPTPIRQTNQTETRNRRVPQRKTGKVEICRTQSSVLVQSKSTSIHQTA